MPADTHTRRFAVRDWTASFQDWFRERRANDAEALPARRDGTRVDNARMPDTDDIDKRLTDLEVKASFSEDLLDHLNDLVARQQEQIALLIREVGKLKDRAPEPDGGARDPREDLPPHY